MAGSSATAPRWSALLQGMDQLSPAALAFWRQAQAAQPAQRQAFMTPTFCRAVDAAQGGRVRVALVHRDGDLVALLPVQRHPGWVGRFGVWEPVGGAMCDYFGILHQEQGLRLDIDAVLARAGLGTVVFTHLDESQLALGLPAEAPRVGLRTLITGEGEQHWEQLRGLDKKLVSDTERRERKLAAEHGVVSFELQSSRPEHDLEELIALKRAQYDRTGKHDAVLFDEANARLLQLLLQSKEPECTGMLSVLRVDGQLVAAHFGLRCFDVLHFWFPAYAKAYAAYSPGRILYRHVIRDGSLQGIRILDRGEGDTAAKRDFANAEHTFHGGTWWPRVPRGVVARFALSRYWASTK